MKRILSIILALSIVISTFVFCYANSEVKLDVRLEFDSHGKADMIFSIPENSNIKEFNLDISYFYLAMDIDSNSEISFESNLSPNEEAFMEWNVVTDRDELAEYEENLYAHCFVDAYYKGKEGLVKGGDLFTLKFNVDECMHNDTFDFNIIVNYIASDTKSEFIVPTLLTYTLYNHNVSSFSTTYNTYSPTTPDLTLFNDTSKLANTQDEFLDGNTASTSNLWVRLGNYYNLVGGSNIYGHLIAQSFSPQKDFIKSIQINLRIDNDPAYTIGNPSANFTIHITDNHTDQSLAQIPGTEYYYNFKNYLAGGDTTFTFDLDSYANDVCIANAGKTYYLKYGWYSIAESRNAWVRVVNVTTSYPVYNSGWGDASNWTRQDNHRTYFKIEYDNDIQEFVDYVGTYLKNHTPDYNNTTKTYLDGADSRWAKLTTTQKDRLSVYSGTKAIVDAYQNCSNVYADYKTRVTDFTNQVNSIGTVTTGSGTKITSAENYYKSYITTSGMISAVSSLKSTLESKRRIFNAIKAINDIGTVTYPGSYNAINAAQNAYNQLISNAERNAVTNYSTLTAAHNKYAQLSNQSQADTVIALINAIGTVTNPGSYSAINNAQAAYNNLTDAQKALVTNYSTLQAAHTKYADLGKANDVISKINAIGTPTYTSACKSKIDAAKTAYNALTATQRSYVSNYSTLTSADTKYTNMNTAYTTLKSKVEALGTLKYTNDYQTKLRAARTALDTAIGYGDSNLNTAIASYKTTIENAETKIRQMQANVQNVIDLIDAIGTVTYPGSYNAINAAQNAYNALATQEEKNAVSNYSKLTAAHAKYKELQDKAEAKKVQDLIDAIGNVTFSYASAEKINAAQAAYDKLTADQQAIVKNSGHYATLQAAHTKYNDLNEAQKVINAINDIGNVTYTSASKSKIDAARNAYKALTTTQQGYVSNYSTLTAAETRYNGMNTAKNNVVTETSQIGTVVYTSACELRIKEARDALDAATKYNDTNLNNAISSQKATIEAAETKILTMRANVNNVISLIDAIGTVSYPDSYTAINKAQAAYDDLATAEEKAAVTNYSKLQLAHTKYADMEKADGVISKINAIGSPVAWNNQSKVTTARSAYNGLTSTQQGYVTNYSTLTAAETRIENMKSAKTTLENKVSALGTLEYTSAYQTRLKAARDALDAVTAYSDDGLNSAVSSQKTTIENAETKIRQMQAEVQNVIDLIDAIGEVTYSDASYAAINAAQTAYINLETDEMRAAVTNYSILQAAHTKYADLYAAHLVDEAIGELSNPVKWNEASKVEAARTAYNSLTSTQKGYVKKLSTLTTAEAKIADLTSKKNTLVTAMSNLTNTIGGSDDVDWYQEHINLINAARTAYNAVDATKDDALIKEVSQYNAIIFEYEAALVELEEEMLYFIELVDKCYKDADGDGVGVDLDKNDEIQAARNYYQSLKPGQKAKLTVYDKGDGTGVINQYQRLVDAENLYMDKYNEAESVITLIASIFEATSYNEKRTRYDTAKNAFDKLTKFQQNHVNTRNGNLLDMALYEFNVDANFLALKEIAGVDGSYLWHNDTTARIKYENALHAAKAYNSEYNKAPYNHKYSYMIIPEENLPKIENKIKLIEGFDSCTKAWVKNGRHTDASDFDTSYYSHANKGLDVVNDPVTDDSQTSIYFQVQPEFLTLDTDSTVETPIIDFNDPDDHNRCSVDQDVFSETTLVRQGGDAPFEGTYAEQMVMGAPLKEIQLMEGEKVKVGGQFFYNFDTPVDLSGYNSFKFSIHTPVALQGQGGQIRVNFITDAGESDGFNFVVGIHYAYTGWNTYTIEQRHLNHTEPGSDWTKIRRVSFTWFNIDQITPKDANGTCFFMFDNLCGLTTQMVNDTVTLDNSDAYEHGVMTSVYFHTLLPENTKITLVELVNSTTKNYYGYTVKKMDSSTNGEYEICLDNFVMYETSNTTFKDVNPYATASTLTGKIQNGMSFILILDFSQTVKPTVTDDTKNGRYNEVSINIRDREEYYSIIERSTMYSITKTYIKTGERRVLSASVSRSTSSITKTGSITFNGSYSISDVGDVVFSFNNGAIVETRTPTDNYSSGKYISVMAAIKNSSGNYIPVANIDVSGVTGVKKGSHCIFFTGVSANQAVTNKSFSLTLNFANCIGIASGNYTLELTVSRVSNTNGALGFDNNVVDKGKVTKTTTFTITDVPMVGLKVAFNSLDGNANTKYIDTTKNNTLSVNVNHQNAKDYTLNVTIQKKNTNGTYSNLSSATYMTESISGTLSTNTASQTKSITLKGNSFNKGSTYRLVFTMTKDNVKIVRYLNLLTKKN